MTLGVDYSFARPGGGTLKNNNYKFAMRYLASYLAKRITSPEVQDLQANGIAIGLVFEDYANPLQNHPTASAFNAGVADAQLAVAQAGAIGFPANLPIYFAVDIDIADYAPGSNDPRAKLGPFASYFDGVVSVLGKNRTGGYGGYYLIKRLFEAGLIAYGWQTLAWSAGQIDGGIHLYQNGQSVLNGSCDVNEARQDNFGQWGDNVAEKINLDTARILTHGVLARNGLAGRANALNGSTDADLKTNHVGQDITNAYIVSLFQSLEGQKWRDIDDGSATSNSIPGINRRLNQQPGTGGGLTQAQADMLARIDAGVQWLKDKIGAIFK